MFEVKFKIKLKQKNYF